MFSAADLIDVLRARRTLRSIRPETPGQLPEGWRRWLEAMPVRRKSVTGASADTFVEAFLGRALRTPPRAPAMHGRLQAFSSLWNQGWSPPSRDERGLRVSGMAASVTLHVLLSAALVWLMDARFLLLPPAAEESDLQVVEVEFMGRGTPADAGGGQAADGPEVPDVEPPPEPAPRAPATAPAQQVAGATPPEAVIPPAPREGPAVAVAVPDIEVQAPPIRERPVPPPAPAQPLAVGEQPRPDDAFLLPPPTPALAVPPSVAPPELVTDAPVVPVREVPEPVAAPRVPTRSVIPTTVAALPTIVPELRERPVDAPVPAMTPDFARAARPAPDMAVPEITARIPEVRARDVPAPARPDAVASDPEAPLATESRDASDTEDAQAAPTPAQAAARVETVPPGGRAGAETVPTTPAGRDAGATAVTQAPGRGPDPATSPGAWESAARDDDWGDALRDRPGAADGRDGLFDETGRPRLADTGPAPGAARPPGAVEETLADFDRAGEWMQRPAFPYEPTRFDRFWIPGGTLLEEWVRRGVRELTVRIPGTSKRLKCVVSVLQLGGGCWVADPNLNEQPSSGRPAPEVPFRPDLFEDPSVLEPAPPGG